MENTKHKGCYILDDVNEVTPTTLTMCRKMGTSLSYGDSLMVTIWEKGGWENPTKIKMRGIIS